VDPELVADALVLPLIAACLHRHAIAPYATSDVAPCLSEDAPRTHRRRSIFDRPARCGWAALIP
jgi:hypothetical protein